MGIRFLSEEWAHAVMNAVNSDPTFAAAAGTAHARIQQAIKTADGEVHYWTTLEDGRLGLGVGDLDNTDVTITQSYETAVGLAKREINPVTAFMMGKIKVDGNMGMLMGLTGVLGKLADAMAALDVEY